MQKDTHGDMQGASMEAESARRFQAVVMPHVDAAYNLARWLMRNESDADDVVQDSCLRAFRSLDGLRGTDARPWFLAIVRNVCFTSLAKKRGAGLHTAFDEDLHSTGSDVDFALSSTAGSDPAALFARSDDARVVNAALEQLPIVFREVVVLRDLEELSYKAIAAIVGIPIGTVMSRLARGRRQLAAQLRARLEEH